MGHLVDAGEFFRFVATGLTAAAGNLAVVWILRRVVVYETALLCGIATGFSISFLLTRLFAFRSGKRQALGGTLARFIAVYGFGVAVNMSIAVVLGRFVLPPVLGTVHAEMAGAFCGSGSMMVTSYFGHRFFTYRTAPDRAA